MTLFMNEWQGLSFQLGLDHLLLVSSVSQHLWYEILLLWMIESWMKKPLSKWQELQHYKSVTLKLKKIDKKLQIRSSLSLVSVTLHKMFTISIEQDIIDVTLLNSLVAFRGTMYHVSIILFWFPDFQFLVSTHDVYCRVLERNYNPWESFFFHHNLFLWKQGCVYMLHILFINWRPWKVSK